MRKSYHVLKKDLYKIIAVAVLLIASCLLLYYFHIIRNSGTFFTHFFYIPTMLAAIWWKRKGIVVPLFLGVLLILSHVFLREYYQYAFNDYLRVFMLILVFSVVCFLSEKASREMNKTQHLNLVLRNISDINQLITEDNEPDRLLQRSCDILIKNRGYYHAWVAVLDDTGKLSITAEAGISDDSLPVTERLRQETLSACDPNFLWQQKIKIIPDPPASKNKYIPAHEYKGNGAMICPLAFGQQIYGCFSVSAPYEVITDREEQALFQRLCKDIAFSLHHLNMLKKRGEIESKLVQSEQKFRQLAEQSPNIIFIYKKDKVIYLNNRHEEITGYTKEFCYAPEFDYINTMVVPEHRELLNTYLRQRRKGKEVMPVEYTFMTQDDSRVDAILNTQLIVYEGEKALLGVITDITEFKKAKLALRTSERRFKETVDLLPQAVYECDVKGKLIFANRKARENFGYTEEDLKRQSNISQMIVPEDRDRAKENVIKIFRGEIVNGMEYTALRKDGTTFPVTIYSSLIKQDNKPTGMRGIIIDNTAHRQMEEELKLKAQMLDLAIDPILICDYDGNITYSNDATSRGTGYPIKKLLDMNIRELVPAESHSKIEKVLKDLKEREYLRTEFTGINADGSRTLLDVSLRSIRSGYKNIVLCASHDITRRVRTEKALQKLNNELEQRMELHTKELLKAQGQLLRQEKLVLLGQLAGGVSHELRNPLGVIKNTTYFLNMILDKSDPEVKEALGILDKEVMNSEQIIKSLLEFAHPGPIAREKTNINNILHDTVNSLSIPDTIDVLYRLDRSLPRVEADISKLDQIFRNIILNAIQAMPEGGKLAIATSLKDSKWVTISILDTGTGIQKDNLDNIFEPLFTTKAKGIGLGLAYTKILVEEHKGTITVQSEIGVGSTFIIQIPVEPPDSGEKEQHDEKNEHTDSG